MPTTTLITGANRGLGLEFARQYAADGWQVYAACRNPKSASELHRLADARGHSLQILALDVTKPASVKAAAAKLDGRAIDLLLNNAGVGGTRGETIGNIDYKAWAKVLDVNTMGPLRASYQTTSNGANGIVGTSNRKSKLAFPVRNEDCVQTGNHPNKSETPAGASRTGNTAKIVGLSRAEPIETEADARHVQRDRGNDEACRIGKERREFRALAATTATMAST